MRIFQAADRRRWRAFDRTPAVPTIVTTWCGDVAPVDVPVKRQHGPAS
jgi:hypothetical protein